MTSNDEHTEPMTTRGVIGLLVVLVLVGAYVAVGVDYARSASLEIAGLSGFSHALALLMQVLGWPLMLMTHP